MSYTRSYHHIVFGTKYRNKCLLTDSKERIYSYITQIIKNTKSIKVEINGIEDHLHILIDLHPTVALAEIVRAIKQSSSKWIRDNQILPKFEGWASEYYACSVSPAHVEAIKNYINNQEEHHKHKGYEVEIREFVRKMGMVLYKDEVI